MPTVLKNDVSTNIARMVYEGIRNKTTRIYFFLGKTLPWTEGTEEDPNTGAVTIISDTTAAPTPNASRLYERETRSNIIGMKLVNITDVAFAIKRLNWSSGTVYDMYDDRYSVNSPAPSGAVDIADARMTVITDEFYIYKCISNNYGAPSTVKPTSTSTGYIGPLSDGYIWKYMGLVDDIQRAKFLNAEYVPVSSTSTTSFLSTGIKLPEITDGGSGYPNGVDDIVVNIIGDGTGAEISLQATDGIIDTVSLDNPGSGYTTASVEIDATATGSGSGATFTVALQDPESTTAASAIDGELSYISVVSGGSGYDSNSYVEIDGNGDGLASATLSFDANGSITEVTLNNRGTNYTSATARIIRNNSNTGNDAELYVIIAPSGGHGKDIVGESYASTLGFHVTTQDEVNQGVFVGNDYRQSGLIISPLAYASPEVTVREQYTADYGSACFLLGVEGIDYTDFPQDMILTNQVTGDELIVVQSDVLKNPGGDVIGAKILVQSLDDTLPEVGDTFTYPTGTTGETASIELQTGDITAPEVDKFSGSMIFINNRTPFRKSIEQIVNLRTYLNF